MPKSEGPRRAPGRACSSFRSRRRNPAACRRPLHERREREQMPQLGRAERAPGWLLILGHVLHQKSRSSPARFSRSTTSGAISSRYSASASRRVTFVGLVQRRLFDIQEIAESFQIDSQIQHPGLEHVRDALVIPPRRLGLPPLGKAPAGATPVDLCQIQTGAFEFDAHHQLPGTLADPADHRRARKMTCSESEMVRSSRRSPPSGTCASQLRPGTIRASPYTDRSSTYPESRPRQWCWPLATKAPRLKSAGRIRRARSRRTIFKAGGYWSSTCLS